MMKKLTTIFITLMMILSFGCAGLDLSKIDTKQVADLVQQVLDQLEKNKPPVVVPPVIPPVVPPVVPPVDPVSINIVVADLNDIPDRMRLAGFGPGSDNAFYYALAFISAFGPGIMPDDGAGSLVIFSKQSPLIEKWWNTEIDKVINTLKSNSLATATVITNDGHDRLGCRLGPAVMQRLTEFPGRVQLGTIYPMLGC